jgi:hypothetical protein
MHNPTKNYNDKFKFKKTTYTFEFLDTMILFFIKIIVKLCRLFDKNAFYAKKHKNDSMMIGENSEERLKRLKGYIDHNANPDSLHKCIRLDQEVNRIKALISEYNKDGSSYFNEFRKMELNDIIEYANSKNIKLE